MQAFPVLCQLSLDNLSRFFSVNKQSSEFFAALFVSPFLFLLPGLMVQYQYCCLPVSLSVQVVAFILFSGSPD